MEITSNSSSNCCRIASDDDESLKLMAEVMKKNNFKVDGKQTVLVGKCADCEG